MKKNILLAVIISLAFIAGCAGGEGEEKVPTTSPFLGGATGVVADFVDLRTEMFDGGSDPFDVIVKLENQGESRVAKEDVRVKLSGFNPVEFGKTEQDLTKSPVDDLTEKIKDPQGNVLPGAQVFVEFKELNHVAKISGARIDFPIRADICYMYSTKAISKICVRSNILNPVPGGVCEVNENKVIFNSGAPVQFMNFRETARAKDKLGFSFEIKNVGTGDLFEMGSVCDRSNRGYEDKVYVKVTTNIDGLTCTGLESKGKSADGFITLFDNSKIITCTQEVSTMTDFEQAVNLEATYDYEEFKQAQITIKSAGQ
ncbi:MAG: hypothetical protein QW666_00685 [Candidatus Woesearchaeota archaeon]